jgi:hypothetical protein
LPCGLQGGTFNFASFPANDFNHLKLFNMKQSKMLLLLGVFTLGFTLPLLAQETLPEVTIKAVRYKYLNAVDNKDVAKPVKFMEKQAAEYDVKAQDFYLDEYEDYSVSFFIPDGEILAAYDKDGKLLRTVEKYKNVAIPKAVREEVTTRFPGWAITKDVYLVNYKEDRGATKVYKLLLENGDKRMKVKTNEKGEFLK